MTGKLKEYNEKRNFERTPEPEGEAGYSGTGLRYIVQHHMARKEHYDLRLEWAGVLLSWAVPKGPSYNTQVRRLAIQVEDHPLDYADFEGTIPKGEYGGGIVMLWDMGLWEPFGNVEDALREGALKFELKGRRLKGKWALIRLKKRTGEDKDSWLLLKEKDEYAGNDDGISEFKTSIRTGRTMEEIEKGEDEKFIKNPFDMLKPQLAKPAAMPPEGDDWLFELKYDGYRIIAFVEANNVRLITRNGYDFSARFYDVASSLAGLSKGRPMVLDGEIVVTDKEGRSDFAALQSYLKNPKGKNLIYIIFDLLALDGVDLRKHPLFERKEMLQKLLAGAPRNLYYSRHVRGNGKESFDAACQAGMEGIVAKRADSIYSGDRNGDWIKIKCDRRQEFVIGGYTISSKRLGGVSSLLLGVYEGENLVYTGRAGSGISESEMSALKEKFKSIVRENSPFASPPKARPEERIIWLEPVLVAEIKFAEWTQDNLLRQASYKGLRFDKDPKSIRKESFFTEEDKEETAEAYPANSLIIHGIRISNPDKPIFDNPRLTKEDVIRYYDAVSERMLPYVSNRLLTAIRCPKGIGGTCFYKKHPGPGSKEIVIMPVAKEDKEAEEYFYIDSAAGLIEEVQMGTIEFHIWGSRVYTLEQPDMMVFDLDPDEGMDLSRVRQGVLDVKSILDELGLKSYLKTSGGKGYHVVVPFEPSVSWELFSDFARKLALIMEQKWPDRYTGNVRKSSRTDRIFIDWIRNSRAATSVAPYSLRARKGAKISMPIGWDELDKVAPDGITIRDALERIASGDPWKDFFDTKQRLK